MKLKPLQITTIRSICFLILLSFSFITYAQNREEFDVSLYVEGKMKEWKQNKNIVSTVVKIVNKGKAQFTGKLTIDAPQGVRPISQISNKVALLPADSLFIPIRFMLDAALTSGINDVVYRLIDTHNRIIDKAESTFTVKDRIDMTLLVETQNIMITNASDSLRVCVTAINKGNTAQEVTVVFSLPSMNRGVNFIEQKHRLEAQEEQQFVFCFVPQRHLMAQNRFPIKIAAMYGSDNILFGNSSVTIQNVSDNSTFEDPSAPYGIYETNSPHTLSVSYHKTNNGSAITQFNGVTDLDLPAGYLNLKGNIYSYGRGNDLTATNTTLSYMLADHKFAIGNIYESLEASLSGRGAKMTLSLPHQSIFTAGVIDQQYNLFCSQPLFNNTYSVFAKAEKTSSHNKLRKIATSAIYQRNAREMSHDMIAGGEMGWMWQNRWLMSLRMHGALSHAIENKKNNLSGSAELRYGGEHKGYNLSGHYYMSSNYFPGNKRGMLSLQQAISKKIEEYSFRANAYYARFTPRSHYLPATTNTSSFVGDTDLYFPKWVNVTFGLGYQHQYEFTNGYRQHPSKVSDMVMRANRLKGTLMWSSQSVEQSVHISSEVGLSSASTSSTNLGQQRYYLSYTLKWLHVMMQYQRGSYYISEHTPSNDKLFERFISSVSANKQLFDDKLSIMTTASINKDYYSGFSPSIYLNMRYNPTKRVSFFVNSYWYSYKFKSVSSMHTFSNEVGLSVYLHKNRASNLRKSKVKTFVYHDYNSNGIYDLEDKPAQGYTLSINDKAFVTSDKGEATYRKVPFGEYYSKQISEKGWFGKADTLKVNSYKTRVEIPLQQTGTISGEIKYNYDLKTAKEVDHKVEGIIFKITSTDGILSYRTSTNDDATFTAFLPMGEYHIELIGASLPANTSCDQPLQTAKVISGKIVKLKPFAIRVKQKRVNIKRFGSENR